MERYNINEIINTALNGDALTELRKMPDESVHCVVTSPPYFQLRNYGTEHKIWDEDPNCEHDFSIPNNIKKSGGIESATVGNHKDPNIAHFDITTNSCSKCGAWKGELGQEPTLDLYIKHLVQIFDEVKRVLRKDGSIWVVIGDTYGGSGNGANDYRERGGFGQKLNQDYKYRGQKSRMVKGIPKKSLLMIPSRFAIAMTDAGWILRNEIIWKKKNCMPSSIKDRFTVDFEKVFFFTKSQKYFFKEQYEPYETGINSNDKPRKPDVERVRDNYYLSKYVTSEYRGIGKKDYEKDGVQNPSDVKRRILESMKTKIKFGGNKGAGGDNATYSGNEWIISPKGRIARTVWEINTQPSPLKHYAIFPEKLVAKCLDPACPEMICDKCNTPYLTIFDEDYFATRPGLNTLTTDKSGKEGDPNKELHKSHWSKYKPIVVRDNFKLVKACECETEDYHKGIVLDIFGGTGTTAVVAYKMNRNYILIEPKKEYIGFIEERMSKIRYNIARAMLEKSERDKAQAMLEKIERDERTVISDDGLSTDRTFTFPKLTDYVEEIPE